MCFIFCLAYKSLLIASHKNNILHHILYIQVVEEKGCLNMWCLIHIAGISTTQVGGDALRAQKWHTALSEDLNSPSRFQQRAVSEQVYLPLLGCSGVPWLPKGDILTALQLANSSERRVYVVRGETRSRVCGWMCCTVGNKTELRGMCPGGLCVGREPGSQRVFFKEASLSASVWSTHYRWKLQCYRGNAIY